MKTKNVLILQSSTRKDSSISRKLVAALVKELKNKFESLDFTFEDLSENPPPHLNLQQINAFFTPDEQLSDKQKNELRYSDKYIEQLSNAEIIIISYPVINFCIPSSLKAWIDQVVRVRKTFCYENSSPIGLLKNKKVYLAVARGGVYTDSLNEQFPDHSLSYLKTVLAYIGLADIRIFKADGQALPDLKEPSLKKTLCLIKEEFI